MNLFELDSALESGARRAAKKVGLVANKSRWRADSIGNLSGFMLIDPYRNFVIEGSRFDLIPEDVIKFCGQRENT